MWIIYRKEMLELARNLRSLLFMLLFPLLAMPVLGLGFGALTLVMAKSAMQADLRYAVFGKENGPVLSQRLAQTAGFKEVELTGPEQIQPAIAARAIQFALVIPPDFLGTLSSRRQSTLELHYNTANAGQFDVVARRVGAVVEEERKRVRQDALAGMGLSRDELDFALNPIRIDTRSTADQRERLGAAAGALLPFMLLMLCLTGAAYPAADMAAGEKERGTLETLLLAPVPRSSLVLAKFLVLFTTGMASALMMLASGGALVAWFGHLLDPELAQTAREVGFGGLGLLALLLAPAAAIFAALLLAISAYATSYKEAQGFMQPLVLAVIFPVGLAVVPGVTLNWAWAMVPLTNIALAMRELLKGTLDFGMYWLILLSTSVLAGALLAWCSWWFTRERVLFRS